MTCDGRRCCRLQWLRLAPSSVIRIEPESKSDFVASIRTSSLRSRPRRFELSRAVSANGQRPDETLTLASKSHARMALFKIVARTAYALKFQAFLVVMRIHIQSHRRALSAPVRGTVGAVLPTPRRKTSSRFRPGQAAFREILKMPDFDSVSRRKYSVKLHRGAMSSDMTPI